MSKKTCPVQQELTEFLGGNPTIKECKAHLGSLFRQTRVMPDKAKDIGRAIVISLK